MIRIITVLLFVVLFYAPVFSQSPAGLWYSADSSRVYEIKATTPGHFTACIQSSRRRGDRVGYVVIRDMVFNNRQQRYEGIMYAVSDDQPARMTLKISKDAGKINLKLSRLIVFNVMITWVRVNDIAGNLK